MQIIKFKQNVKIPKYSTKFSACADIFMPETFVVQPHSIAKVSTYIGFKIPENTKIVMYPRSSTLGRGLIIPVSIIDADYNDAVHVSMYNYTDKRIIVHEGERLVQIEIQPVVDVKEFEHSETIRNGGFGSTNV